MKIGSIVFAAVLYLSMSITAARASGWSGDVTITDIYARDLTDEITVFTAGGSQHVTGCAANRYILTANTNDRLEKMLSLLTTAMVTGKNVRIEYRDTCATFGYHGAIAVRIRN